MIILNPTKMRALVSLRVTLKYLAYRVCFCRALELSFQATEQARQGRKNRVHIRKRYSATIKAPPQVEA